MKKIKFLPLLAVGLLALVGCNSSGGQEISRNKARSLYDEHVVYEYTLNAPDRWNGIDIALSSTPEDKHYPQFIDGKSAMSIPDVAAALSTTEVYGYISLFHNNTPVDITDAFFNNTDEPIGHLAEEFQEEATYLLEGKELKVHFTGSMDTTIGGKEYALAMYFEIQFNKKGLATKGQFELMAATDLDKTEASTLIRFDGEFVFTYTEL